MPTVEIGPEAYARLAALAAARGVTPGEYADTLMRALLHMPDPANWLERLRDAAHAECRAAQDAAKLQAPSEEAIPAYLPLSALSLPTTGQAASAQHDSHVDSFSLFLELIATFYLEVCADDPAHPRTGEIAALETYLAERYFYPLSFPEFRSGVLGK